jgi:hypothetical protein
VKRLRVKRALAAAVLAAAGPAYCADSIWIATGEATKDDYYLGLGVIIPLPGYILGHGWAQRYWLDNYTYSYNSGPTRIDAAYGEPKRCLAIRLRSLVSLARLT